MARGGHRSGCGIGRLPLAAIATVLAWIVLWALARIQPVSKDNDSEENDGEKATGKAERPGKKIREKT